MSIFSRLFGEKKKPPAPPAKPVDFTEGLTYDDVRDMEDPVRRWAMTKRFADKGDGFAQYELGIAYLMGDQGVEEDWGLAEKYLLMAAQSKVAAAYTDLGTLYIRQSFVSEPEPHIDDAVYEKGCGYLARGAVSGQLPAILCICGDIDYTWNTRKYYRIMFLREMNRQLEEPVRELEQQDTPQSNYTLGMFCQYGVYYPQDFVKAREYLQRSADGGSFAAKMELEKAVFDFDDEDDDE